VHFFFAFRGNGNTKKTMKPGLRDFLWMAVGATIFGIVFVVVLVTSKDQSPAARLALKDRKVEIVNRMRTALASASEAENSAVMATTDEESQTFANEARTATATLQQSRAQLSGLLDASGSPREKDLLAEFSKSFVNLERVDRDLLALAVQNTNLKAYRLAFGPASEALQAADEALAHLVTGYSESNSADSRKIILLADDARISALRIQTLLPPHIAEESDQKMDELEARMTREDLAVRKILAGLAAIRGLAADKDLATAVARYEQFTEIRSQILKLSRENTNVRSLAISLNQKRRAMLLCQDALTGLEQEIEEAFIRDERSRAPVSTR
jgi:hypothetical protein